MTRFVLSAVLLLVTGVVGASVQIVRESPFACNISTLSASDRARKDEIGRTLAARRLAVRELADGYEFVFPGDTGTFQLVAEWTATERLCCPFFDVDLRLEREGGSIALRLTGRTGTKAFIKADFERWLK